MSARFKSNFTFGNAIAESDHLLSTSYFDNGDYEAIKSHDDKRCFIIGRTGSGKTAAFQRLSENYPGKVVRIDPESLSLPYILNIGIMRDLLRIGVHLEPFMKTLWKHVIVVEILRHRYTITSPEQKQNVLQSLISRLKRDQTKIKALEYLDEFGDKFWCDTDERVKQIADTLVKKMGLAGDINASIPTTGIGIKASSNIENTHTQEIKQEIVNKYQKIINDTQLPRLNEMLTILNNEILESTQHFTYLIIDDLDKEWVDEDLAILLIKCLFQAVIDMQKVNNLKILVALRTNIFNQLNHEKQARGGQEEKLHGLAIELRWTINDLKNLLEARATAASEYYEVVPPKTLLQMLPDRKNKRENNPVNYIIDRTLMRPRDSISFLNLCVRAATGKDKISWEDIRNAERTYSQDRLFALRDEWKDPYIGIEKVFDAFKNQQARISRKDMTRLFEEIAILPADTGFLGEAWLNEICKHMFYEEKNKEWNYIYKPLANFLYGISFIGIARNLNGKAMYSYDENGSTNITEELSETIYFEIHPTFHKALDIKSNSLTQSKK